jgi:hypothetical protein
MTASGHLAASASDDAPPLRDRDDVESFRFALAQQAWLAGDTSTLRKLLPIALSTPQTDMPARNDFARRLTSMGAAAQKSPVPAAQLETIRARTDSWQRALSAIRYARLLLQLMLWSGLACLVIGLILRWSCQRIQARIEEIASMAASPRRSRTIANVTLP